METTFIPLSDPHVTLAEIEAVTDILRSPRISAGPAVEAFEQAFAAYTGRKYAIAVCERHAWHAPDAEGLSHWPG